MTRTADGACHLYYSRWPRDKGHNAWVTHSEVAYATAPGPLGPYTHQGVALPRRAEGLWDADVTHNPTVVQADGKFYLYYTGNHGNGEYWDHRNHQRVGVAVADSPSGPWQRFDQPLLDVTPGSFDAVVTTNPSVTRAPDGRWLLVYKCVADGPEPKRGPVRHSAAWADHPTGPFRRIGRTILEHPTAFFPAEDPFVWHGGDRFYAIAKDMGDHFYPTGDRRASLVLFESANGEDWQLAPKPLVSLTQVTWADGQTQKLGHLERPQLWLENGQPKVLFCAADVGRDHSFNVAIPLAAR
jgi:predicted GH43/DUF377 family glycosyl hydrolase